MIKTLIRSSFALALMLLIVGSPGAYSDEREEEDHEQALRALQEGRAKPLAAILEVIARRFDGEIVGVEFEREAGRYVYEFKIVAPDGRLREVYIDALTAKILSGEDD